jgi:phospho-N-acetylmuramoyl-pentapeptide-transferase
MIPLDVLKVLVPSVITFVYGMGIAPLVTYYLYHYRVWKKRGAREALDGSTATEFNRLHGDLEAEVRTPRMGGIVIWASVFLTVVTMALIGALDGDTTGHLSFLSREQTWIPLFVFFVGALVGFINDWRDVYGAGDGLKLRYRLAIILALSSFVGWWFYTKLAMVTVTVPFVGAMYVGIWIIPLFIAVSLLLYASGVIDGIDGLSGGVFASIFASYAIIAFSQSQYDIAALCAAILGGVLAFLWFNIPPARFYMTETGTMALTLVLATIAFMTDALGEGMGLSVLPIIGFLLFVTVASNVIQVCSKKFFGRKVFRIAPLHHHFEAIGWPSYKVTMRYWVLSVMCAFVGVVFALLAA